jgi:pimeloyl-ACP methyl ester carboxylesterase
MTEHWKRLSHVVLLAFVLAGSSLLWAQTTRRWEQLPPTPDLPKPDNSGVVRVEGSNIWYGIFGHGSPVVLLHGGPANSNYWGHQIPVLAQRFEVVAIDSRGQGRSTYGSEPFTYHGMAMDVLAVMDALKIRQATVIGWSDGAIVGLDMAVHHPERLTKLFAFGAASDASGVSDAPNAIVDSYFARCEKEYAQLSPTPAQHKAFWEAIVKMWSGDWHFSDEQLREIKTRTWIVDGDHDEVIKRENFERLAATIPGAVKIVLSQTSHFAMLQDPAQFNQTLLRFLALP